MSAIENILKLIIIISAILTELTGKPAMGNDSTTRLRTLVQGLPETIEQWNKSGNVAVYDGDSLYTYINGGAELYISYQFLSLISQPYVNAEGEEIKIDIFDMGVPQNAYGVFSHSLEMVDDFVNSDIESEYGGGLLTFWKGRYYVSILAYPETESRKRLVQQLARNIAAQIDEQSVKPQIVSLLPEDMIQPNSIRYFSHHTWMNMYHFFSHENLLHIDEDTEVAMAKYRVGTTKPAVLIILNYPDETAAAAAHNSFKHNFMDDVQDDYRVGDNDLWTGCARNENMLVIVVDAPSLSSAQRLVQGVEKT